jgi:hypothetical protein
VVLAQSLGKSRVQLQLRACLFPMHAPEWCRTVIPKSKPRVVGGQFRAAGRALRGLLMFSVSAVGEASSLHQTLSRRGVGTCSAKRSSTRSVSGVWAGHHILLTHLVCGMFRDSICLVLTRYALAPTTLLLQFIVLCSTVCTML